MGYRGGGDDSPFIDSMMVVIHLRLVAGIPPWIALAIYIYIYIYIYGLLLSSWEVP